MPWLQAHNPQIDWTTGKVVFQSAYCLHNCLQTLHHSVPVVGCLKPTSESQDLVPPVYHDFLDVFDKQKADTLPPHRAYDCPIELFPGAEIPFGRIFPLSEPELLVKDYVNENLEKGSSDTLLLQPEQEYSLLKRRTTHFGRVWITGN